MIEEYGEIPDDETIAAAQSVSQHDDVISSVAGACVTIVIDFFRKLK